MALARRATNSFALASGEGSSRVMVLSLPGFRCRCKPDLNTTPGFVDQRDVFKIEAEMLDYAATGVC